MKPYFATGLMLSSLVTGSVHGHDMYVPECATTCSRGLSRYRFTNQHNIPTKAVCMDMAKQRELFLCLANSCGEDYGPALAYTISACSNYGALITDLLPVELQHVGLAPRRFSHLTPRFDTGRFAFGDQFTLAVDCTAGSNGVLTLSLPDSVPSGIPQPPPTDDSPLIPGSGAGDPNLDSSPLAGNTDPVLGSQPAGPSTSHRDQSGTFAHAASNNPGGNENPSNGVGNPAAVDADCDPATEGSNNNPSGAPNNGQAQHPSGSSPSDSDPSPNGQPDGQPNAPSLNPADGFPASTVPGADAGSPPLGHRQGTSGGANDGSGSGPGDNVGSLPSGPNQETPGRPPSQPAPIPVAENPTSSAPSGDAGVPGHTSPPEGAGENCEDDSTPTPGSGASGNSSPQSSAGNQGNPAGCAVGTDNPACGNHNQGPPGTPVIPSPGTQNPGGCPERADGSPDCGASSSPPAPPVPPAPQEPAPASSPAVPVPGQGDPNCPANGPSPCPVSGQPPNPTPPSVPNPNSGPGGGDPTGNPGSPQTGPSPMPPNVPGGCSGDAEGSSCPIPGSNGPDPGAISLSTIPTPPGPPPASNTAAPPTDAGSPRTQGETNPLPSGNGAPCDGSLGLCPGSPSTPENGPVPYSQESSPNGQVPPSPSSDGGWGSDSAQEGDDSGDGVPSCNGNCPTSPGSGKPLDPGTANSPSQSPGSHNSQSPNDPQAPPSNGAQGQTGGNLQAPGDPAASGQPSSPVTGPSQPAETFIRADPPSETFIRADRPTTTEFVKAIHPPEDPSAPYTDRGPQVITVLAPTKVEITQTRIITV
ncbi:hypothetical protein FALCPG4_005118 [Fusarium falciforme]